jgi:hypothetical protein
VKLPAALVVVVSLGCSSSAEDRATTQPPDTEQPTNSCEAFGRFAAPKTTFTLPADKPLAYPDIQKSFPDVDWSTLDRLYIPAGKYKSLLIHNLPTRSADRPLVITNLGGQVQIGPNDPGGNYLWSMTGGSNWILTGRYDPESKTGDAAFPGHRCGAYASSRGKYGFISDDAYAKGTYLHMGVAVGDATDFELEYLEVMHSGFAGIRLLNERKAGDAPHPMANVRVHDTYVHDTDGEGFYFGWTGAPPSNLLPGLRVWNNRIVRTGNEGLQVQDLGEGSEIHHNVIAFSALHWRDNGLGHWQDGNTQMLVREGNVAFHHNVLVGGSSLLLSFFSSPEGGDGPSRVTFHDNYFGDTLSLAGYLNGAPSTDSSFMFERNTFTGVVFGYDKLDPAAKDPGALFGVNDKFRAPVTFTEAAWDGAKTLAGEAANVGVTSSKNGPVPRLAFRDGDESDADPKRHLEAWAPVATVADAKPAIAYQPGDRVMHLGALYECTASSSAEPPSEHPSSWKKLDLPNDDLRVPPDSPYAEYGVH